MHADPKTWGSVILTQYCCKWFLLMLLKKDLRVRIVVRDLCPFLDKSFCSHGHSETFLLNTAFVIGISKQSLISIHCVQCAETKENQFIVNTGWLRDLKAFKSMNGVSATVVTENTSKGEKSADTVRPHVNVVLHLVVNAIFASLRVCTGHRHYHCTCQRVPPSVNQSNIFSCTYILSL